MNKQQGARLSAAQIELANQMKESGIEWKMIAVYFKTTTSKLLKYRRMYEQQIE